MFVPGINLQFSKMKQMKKCPKPAFFLLTNRGQIYWKKKSDGMKVNAKLTLLLIYELS